MEFAKRNNVEVNIPEISFTEIKKTFPESRSWAGVCSNNKIFIDIFWWRNSDSIDREQVVLHELGHCVLGLGHSPRGIMSESKIPDGEYIQNRDVLIDELFKRSLLVP